MIRNQKGQVAIFIALIFQVLFLFFAMVVNVGLLVHQKINLQNSVDLAAYYGAMKQAESLNAIAHINYQIRQDWKLLAWRYRVLGSAGDTADCFPYSSGISKLLPDALESQDPLAYTCNGRQTTAMYSTPSFCISYSPFQQIPRNENTCKDMLSFSAINVMKPPPVVAGFYGTSQAVRSAVITARDQVQKQCEFLAGFSWTMLARFKVAYIRDQAVRKQAINVLANDMSGYNLANPTEDFRELNGELASVGISETLKNNLTEANRDSFLKDKNIAGMKIYNSLADPNCGSQSGDQKVLPPKWLSEIKIVPAFATVTRTCKANDPLISSIGNVLINLESVAEGQFSGATFNPGGIQSPSERDGYTNMYSYMQGTPLLNEFLNLGPLVASDQAPYNASLGFEKNPWCDSYVGVKAATYPRIPFMPLSQIRLEAQAFAKPFGGRIGPWFFKTWQPGAFKSTGTEQTDKRLPIRVDNISNINAQNAKDPTRIPNYSRFPGDDKGLMSRASLGYYAQALFEMASSWVPTNPLPSTLSNFSGDSSPDFNHWSKIAENMGTDNKADDILAWDNVNDHTSQMRYLELSAIAPDLFDTTYYSIDPNYYNNYYIKIMDHLKRVNVKLDLPSDLGSRVGDSKLASFSVKDQIDVQNKLAERLNAQNQLQYLVLKPDNVLNGWVPMGASPGDYTLDTTRFGTCGPADQPDADTPIPGNCVNGGRVGYSVKIVNESFLKSSGLQLGGEGASAGALMNPPPNDF